MCTNNYTHAGFTHEAAAFCMEQSTTPSLFHEFEVSEGTCDHSLKNYGFQFGTPFSRVPCESSNLWKSNGVVHCSIQKAAASCVNRCERYTQYWASPSEERRRKKKKEKVLAALRVLGLVLSWCFLASLGVLLVMKTLEDEWYVVIKTYKLAE